MKTLTTNQINQFIQRNGGSVSIEELVSFLSGSDTIVTELPCIPNDFSIIEWFRKECPEFWSEKSRSLITGFVKLHTTYGWSYEHLKAKFIEEAAERKSDSFSLTRCLFGSLSKDERDILPYYKGSFIGYILFDE